MLYLKKIFYVVLSLFMVTLSSYSAEQIQVISIHDVSFKEILGFRTENIATSRFYPTGQFLQLTHLSNYCRLLINLTILACKVPIKNLSSDLIEKIRIFFPEMSEEDDFYVHVQRPGMGKLDLALLRPHYVLYPVDIAVDDVPEKVFKANPRLVGLFPSVEYTIEDPDTEIIVHTLSAQTRDDYADLSPNNLKVRVGNQYINDYFQHAKESSAFFSYVEGNGHKALTLHIIPCEQHCFDINAAFENIESKPSMSPENKVIFSPVQPNRFPLSEFLRFFPDDGAAFSYLKENVFPKS
ncbi:MAG: hypothetical protein CNLJKLNK_01159 [Holosporales bacterium]